MGASYLVKVYYTVPNVLIAEADQDYWIVVSHSHIFSRRQFVAHLSSIVYVSDMTCDRVTCSCLTLHVHVLMIFVCVWQILLFKKIVLALFNLSLRTLFLSAITCVQETFSCPPLPVFNKLERIRYPLCSINLNVYGIPYELQRVLHILC